MDKKTLKNSSIDPVTKSMTFAIFAISSVLMFGLAFTASAATLTRQLELGMRGSDVSDLQTFLAQDRSVYPQGLVTGYFGTLTKAAVSNFQVKNGISAVGRVGPITLSAINTQMNSGIGNTYTPIINSLSIANSSTTSIISWNTSNNASAILYYSTSPISLIEASPTSPVTIGGSSLLVNDDLRSSHTANVTRLNPNTTYHYVLYWKDASGNENITWPGTLQTSQ